MISEEDVKDWQQLPMVSSVLSSAHMGAWLFYRDKRRTERLKLEIIQDILNTIYTYNFDTTRDINIVTDVLKEQLEEQK